MAEYFAPEPADVIPAFQIAGVMENRGGDRQFPVTLLERSDDRVLPVGSQQVGHCGGRLHGVIKIVERGIARLELRIFSVKKFERKSDQRVAKTCFSFRRKLLAKPGE